MYADRITRYVDTVMSTSFYCVGVNGQNGNGQNRNGLAYNVRITATPNTTTYAVGDLVTLMCTVDPPIATSSNINVTYSWQCNGCFADGITDMVIVIILTEMDNATIDCSATINNETLITAVPFDLLVTQGRVVCVSVSGLPKSIMYAYVYLLFIICLWIKICYYV